MATPSIVNPLSAYFCWKPIIQGISTRQGSHQVAQKFTTTTFPFKLASGTSWPCRSLKVTAGSSGRGPLAAEFVVPTPETLNQSWELQPEKFVVTMRVTSKSSRKKFG